MIPKIIHYCWFGRNEKPKAVQKCIKSWKKHCPDYQIIEWNEDNYDISSAPLFVRQVFDARKWGFIADYIRLEIIYTHGGIYLDTDVEAIQSFDGLLKNSAFWGFEYDNQFINSGLGFGAEKGTPILLDLMDIYKSIPFIRADGSYDLTPCTYRETKVFIAHGLRVDGTEQTIDNSIHIYPSEYLCPCNWRNGEVKKTNKTISIHWYNMSWKTKEEREKRKRKLRKLRIYRNFSGPIRIVKSLIGQRNFNKLKKVFGLDEKRHVDD